VIETREQAILNLHGNLAHSGSSADCIVCDNLATTLGWGEPAPEPVILTGALVKAIYDRYSIGSFCSWDAVARDILKIVGGKI